MIRWKKIRLLLSLAKIDRNVVFFNNFVYWYSFDAGIKRITTVEKINKTVCFLVVDTSRVYFYLVFHHFIRHVILLNEFSFSYINLWFFRLSLWISFQLEKLISKNYFLNQSGKEAFKSYVRAYDSHQLKNIFDISTLDLQKVAVSFGFNVPPVVDLSKFIQNNYFLFIFYQIATGPVFA